MRILADENVARDVVGRLRTSGYDVLFATEVRDSLASHRSVLLRLDSE